MSPEVYDVAVVGAGPGGATAARLLAEWGHSVVLLTRRGDCGAAGPVAASEHAQDPGRDGRPRPRGERRLPAHHRQHVVVGDGPAAGGVVRRGGAWVAGPALGPRGRAPPRGRRLGGPRARRAGAGGPPRGGGPLPARHGASGRAGRARGRARAPGRRRLGPRRSGGPALSSCRRAPHPGRLRGLPQRGGLSRARRHPYPGGGPRRGLGVVGAGRAGRATPDRDARPSAARGPAPRSRGALRPGTARKSLGSGRCSRARSRWAAWWPWTPRPTPRSPSPRTGSFSWATPLPSSIPSRRSG